MQIGNKQKTHFLSLCLSLLCRPVTPFIHFYTECKSATNRKHISSLYLSLSSFSLSFVSLLRLSYISTLKCKSATSRIHRSRSTRLLSWFTAENKSTQKLLVRIHNFCTHKCARIAQRFFLWSVEMCSTRMAAVQPYLVTACLGVYCQWLFFQNVIQVQPHGGKNPIVLYQEMWLQGAAHLNTS